MSAVKAVIFDWSGTVVDFGSRAPVEAFIAVFGEFGVAITVEEARGPMGLPKRDHILTLARVPRIAAAWQEVHGRPFDDADIDRVHETFEPLTRKVAARLADLVPGTAEVVAELRRRGIRIGSTTGYTRPVMTPLARLAAEQGFAPDIMVCSGDLAAGRPTPLMMYRCFTELAVWPAGSVVKVDDTAPGIEEATAAGSWAVGVAMSGNAVGFSHEELSRLDAGETARLRGEAAATLRDAGAHYIVDTVADLLPVIDAISVRLDAGHMPDVPA